MNGTNPPKFLKITIALLAFATLWLALLPGAASVLGLSNEGISRHFYWQWLTYALFEPAYRGLHFSLFLQLGFSLYLLWIFGTSLIERLGERRFSYLLFGSALAGGLAAWLLLKAFHLPHLFAGLTPLVYGLLFAWTMLNKRATILLFLAIPFNACRGLYILIALALLTDLSEKDWPAAGALLAAIGYAYLFIRFFHPTLTSISWFQTMKWRLIRWKNRVRNWIKKPPAASYRPSKIYDIRSGKPVLDDEQFMDAMLARISLYGENSLSPEDQKRMKEISKKGKKKY